MYLCRALVTHLIIARDGANASVFVSHTSFLGVHLRERLMQWLEIVCNIMWLFS